MPKLIEVFPDWMTNGLFIRLGGIFPDLEWARNRGSELDFLYFGNHSGDKETSPLIDKITERNGGVVSPEMVTVLSNVIYTKYGVTWDKLYKVLSEQYNPIENYSMVEEETPNITRTETPNVTKTNTTTEQRNVEVTTDADSNNKVYGFNSTSAVPQSETSNGSTVTTKSDADKNVVTETGTETGTRTETETGNRRLTRSGNIGVTTSQQMLESEIKLWEWSFYETVFKDVDKILTSPLYN